MRTEPGRVLKGHHMAGHMGNEQVTIHNRPVIVSDAQNGVLAVKGPVPGPNGSTIFLTKESPPADSKK